jgi:hypothetical protein
MLVLTLAFAPDRVHAQASTSASRSTQIPAAVYARLFREVLNAEAKADRLAPKGEPTAPAGGRYRLALSLTPDQETKLEEVAADWSHEDASLETQAGTARQALRGLPPDSPTATIAAQRAVLMKVVAQQVALAQSARETLAGDLGSDAFASFENHLRAYAPRPGPTLGAAKIQQMKPREECESACAYPMNWQQPAVASTVGTELEFYYTWQSSTGNQFDLANCYMGEYVTFSGLNQNGGYPSPPFPSGSGPEQGNPTENPVPAVNLQTYDNNGNESYTASDFQRPLTNANVGFHQIWGYQCPCVNGGDWVTLADTGNPSGAISVYQCTQPACPLPGETNGLWYYALIKGNYAPASLVQASSFVFLALGSH